MSDQSKARPFLQLRFDMRAPAWGASRGQLYEAALEMSAYADAHGFDAILLTEHHGVEDGYCPSSITLATAIAARTKRVQLRLCAIAVPLYHPLRLAEQIAVLDNISNGRTLLVAVGGYVPSEFEMFGQDYATRGRAVEDCVSTLRSAWTGEPFIFDGRSVRVTPPPINPDLPIYLGGGPVAARRAARIADGFITHDPAIHQIYVEEAAKLGRDSTPIDPPSASVFVTDDPERMWDLIGRHALHETNGYGQWQSAQDAYGRYDQVMSVDDLRATGNYMVVTPEDCLAMIENNLSPIFHPLVGGLDPEVGFNSLRLFVEQVMPKIAPSE